MMCLKQRALGGALRQEVGDTTQEMDTPQRMELHRVTGCESAGLYVALKSVSLWLCSSDAGIATETDASPWDGIAATALQCSVHQPSPPGK
jgi:hypothetical protein